MVASRRFGRWAGRFILTTRVFLAFLPYKRGRKNWPTRFSRPAGGGVEKTAPVQASWGACGGVWRDPGNSLRGGGIHDWGRVARWGRGGGGRPAAGEEVWVGEKLGRFQVQVIL